MILHAFLVPRHLKCWKHLGLCCRRLSRRAWSNYMDPTQLTLVADQKRLSVPRGPVHIHDSSPSWTNVKKCQGLTQDNITVPTIGFACLRFGSQKTWFLRLLPITSSYLYHSISISISIAISLSVYLPTYLSTNLPIYLSIYLPIYPSIHPSIHPSM